jgi:hypothetical protein
MRVYQYEDLYAALGNLNEAKQRVKDLEAEIQQLMVGCIPDADPVKVKRVYKKRKKNGKWSTYKKMKFALKCKDRWAHMTAEEKAVRVQKMLSARRHNKKG